MKEVNVVSISGGKDSIAMALLALERNTQNLKFVFADTGHEHALTYEYLDYLETKIGKIERVKANFDRQIQGKRDFINKKWAEDGVSQAHIDKALDLLHPTGNPFLDLCLWKGRFPSTRRRFCSEELKHKPIQQYQKLLIEQGFGRIVSWQGVRRDESRARAKLDEWEINFGDPDTGAGLWNYRPILDWTAQDCFDMHKKHGVEPNPLYKMGMGRVGCMPCIHCTKPEMREIAKRFPGEIERVSEWEKMVSTTSKTGVSIMMDARVVQRSRGLPKITAENAHTVTPETHGIMQYAEWAKTERGGRQYSLIHAIDADDVPQCSSVYGLCE